MDNRRKTILYVILGAIVLIRAGEWGYEEFVEKPLQDQRRTRDNLLEQISQTGADLKKMRKISDQLAVWERQSLPSDVDVARSLYRAWLLALVGECKFLSPNVDSVAAVNRPGFKTLSYSIRGRATLEQLNRFLFEFYSADFLHQLRSLAITPLQSDGLLDVAISIEAASLPTAESTSPLTRRRAERLAFSHIDNYRVILQRNLFRFGSEFDAVSQTYLSGVTLSDDRPEAWFTLRASDQVLRLHRGERLQVGPFEGTIVAIDDSDVTIASDGEHWQLSIGENLDQAFALPPEYATESID
jgi:hypothetical protein